jgi:hypothetical protein
MQNCGILLQSTIIKLLTGIFQGEGLPLNKDQKKATHHHKLCS